MALKLKDVLPRWILREKSYGELPLGSSPLTPYFFNFTSVAPVGSSQPIAWQGGAVYANARSDMVGAADEGGVSPSDSVFVKLLEPGLWVVQAQVSLHNTGENPTEATATVDVSAWRESRSSSALVGGGFESGTLYVNTQTYIPLTQGGLDAVPIDYPGLEGEAVTVLAQATRTGVVEGVFTAEAHIMAIRLGDLPAS